MKLANLENQLGHSFRSIALLERALTHRSWAHEHLPGETDEKLRETENESFEFVGDSVLGLVVAEHLFLNNPGSSEGDLTLMKHHLVSTTTLAKIARTLNLGEFIRMGRGEEKTRGREKPAILADTLEAVIAAVFFDSGYIAARACVGRTKVFCRSRVERRQIAGNRQLDQSGRNDGGKRGIESAPGKQFESCETKKR